MPERATVLNRSEKSAEAIVAAGRGRRAEGIGELALDSLDGWISDVRFVEARQKTGEGEALLGAGSEESLRTDREQNWLGWRVGELTAHQPQRFQPPGADPHAGWCGRGSVSLRWPPLSRSIDPA